MARLTLDQRLMEEMSFIEVGKEAQKERLCSLKENLDVYLLTVMEEEDPLFGLLYERDYCSSTSFGRIKTISPNKFRLNLLFKFPLLPNDVEVHYSTPGFVKIKLPLKLEEKLQCSKLWREACYKEIQNSLLRHLKCWMDEDNYLLQTAVNKWLSSIVDKALQLTGNIPNLQVQRLPHETDVVLKIKDTHLNETFTLFLVPVLEFPSSLLPEDISRAVPESTNCNKWLVESLKCRSDFSSNLSWGISLWHHEQNMFASNPSAKNIVRLIKGLRIGKQWENLKNIHIKNHVMLELQERPSEFSETCPSKLFVKVLLNLQRRLVSEEGIPFFWDRSFNVLCGLTGPQRVELARCLKNVLSDLSQCEKDSSFQISRHFREASTNESSHSFLATSPSSSSPAGSTYRFVPERPHNTGMQQNQSSGWMWAAGAAALGTALMVSTILSSKNKK